ncbi:MAG: SUMF1/EgtB/PvdO family nonheme iron enzyme [Muribaculaceae bacterium]|nr:SUMF1/EgtB/PvdO family nonheme iron enzyme [Muribaculaceae bacterium]
MKTNQFTLRHLLMAFACGMLLVGGLSLTAPQRVSSNIYGDVNGDGVVDIEDVSEVINVILGYYDGHGDAGRTMTYTVGGVSFTMVGVNHGTFIMGGTDEQGADVTNSELPTHRVTLTKDFSIGQTEVTQALWISVMGSNPSHFTPTNGYALNLQRPVEQVSYDDCQAFIAKLNELTGKQFRLPTEAEWEYASRGGQLSQGFKYAGSNNIDDVAWHNANSESVPQTVGTKAPNELGLYDMSGNVYEWVEDWFAGYNADDQVDPMCTQGSIDYRVTRGGSVGGTPKYSRITYRAVSQPASANMILGLRLAM